MADGLPCPCCGVALAIDAHYQAACPHCGASLDERIDASRSDDDDDRPDAGAAPVGADREELVADGGRSLVDEHLVCSECGAESRPGYEPSNQRCPEKPSVVDDRSHEWDVHRPDSQGGSDDD